MPALTGLGRTAIHAFVRRQTYLNLVYLLLAFPLGLIYFGFLAIGLAVGFALILALVGIPILLLVHVVAWALMNLERWLAIRLLGVDIPPMSPVDPQGPIWRRLIGKATDTSTWTGMFFLLAKFPLGLVAFLLTIVLLSASIAFTAAPVLHLAFAIPVGPWSVDSLVESLLLAPLGVLIGVLSMNALNYTASLYGRFAWLTLGARWWEVPSPLTGEGEGVSPAIAPSRP